MLTRRFLLATGSAALIAAAPARAQTLRGALGDIARALEPGSSRDQTAALQSQLEAAAAAGQPFFLPHGDYRIAGVRLPKSISLIGVAGATRLLPAKPGPLLVASGSGSVRLSGLTLDGERRAIQGPTGLLLATGVTELVMDDCAVRDSGANGIHLDGCGGRIERTSVSGAAEAGIFAVQSAGLDIVRNRVFDCGNGGILVHRREPGEDRTSVSQNRIDRIRADRGGTGQFGNGINIFRAGSVIVSGNSIADCAFSAIRSNGGGNVEISGNQCLRSGETAIYSEFIFEGAVISGNTVDVAANGISVVNFNQGGRLATVSGNIVRNLSTRGPYPADAPGFGVGITIEADTAVTGNVVENAPRFGLHLGWGPYLRNVSATGNVLRNCGEGIAVTVVEGAGSAVIADNLIAGARDGAIVGHLWSDATARDLAVNASRYPHLTISGNRIVD